MTDEADSRRIISSSTVVVHVSDPFPGMMIPTSVTLKSPGVGFLIVRIAIRP
jgi:hypothetical protein